VNSFENAYLARSMSRLFDPVNNMFTAEEGIPSHETMDSLLRTVMDELAVSMVESHLNKVVASNVANTIKLFCTKCEQQVVTGSESTQLIGKKCTCFVHNNNNNCFTSHNKLLN
jgi:conserved oligomeric Golgi complex subunit 5